MYLVTGWSVLLVIGYITPFTPALAGLPTDHFGNLANALIISYAILKYNLLNISFVMRRGLTYIILVGTLVGVYVGAILLGFNLLPELPLSGIIILATVMAAMLALAARPVRFVIEEGIDRLFYWKTYDYRQALLDFSRRMSNIINLEELAAEMLSVVVKAIHVKEAKLLFRDFSSNDFTTQFTYPVIKGSVANEIRFSVDNPIVAWLHKNSEPLNIDMIDNTPEFKGLWQEEKEQIAASRLRLLLPIKSGNRLVGILALGRKEMDTLYSHEDLELVITIASQVGTMIENAQRYSQALTRANTDGLTGLYNHRHFHERLEQEIARGSRYGSTLSLIMIDADLFKAYNDIHGHLAGDEILRRIAMYIKMSIRTIDLPFRYGGEEFAVILPEARLDDAYKVAERIRKTIASKTSSRATPITVSIGIGNWPADGVMKEETISAADVALYRAKQTGRNRTCLSTDVSKAGAELIGTELEERSQAMSIIYALAATVDAKDHYTYGHSKKVSDYSVVLAEALDFPEEKVEVIRAAGLLHDIGKIGIPDSSSEARRRDTQACHGLGQVFTCYSAPSRTL
jgi:diguanylate cyclase (GGDEF)-like protein